MRGWLNLREVSGLLYDKKLFIKLKAKYYKAVLRQAILYGLVCWAMNKKMEQKMSVEK